MTGKDLATSTGVKPGTVENWLQGRGHGKIPADWVAQVARILKTNPRWLLLNEGPVVMTSPGEAERLVEAIRRLVDPSRSGSDEAARALLSWAWERLPEGDPTAAEGS